MGYEIDRHDGGQRRWRQRSRNGRRVANSSRMLTGVVTVAVLAASMVGAAVAQPARPFAPGRIAYNQYTFESGQPVAQLWTINPDGSDDQQIAVALPEAGHPVWSRDGAMLALTSVEPLSPARRSKDAFLFDPWTGARLNLTGFQDSTEQIGQESFYSYHLGMFKAFAPDGQRIVVSDLNGFGDFFVDHPQAEGLGFTGSSSVLWLATPTADGPLSLMMGDLREFYHDGEGVDWAPDQDLLAYPIKIAVPFENSTVPSYVTALHLLEPVTDPLATGHGRQLTFPSGRLDGFAVSWQDDFLPVFSPDGRSVAYVRSDSDIDGVPQWSSSLSLRIIGVDGSNDREIASFDPGLYISRVSWSPDGAELAFDLGPRYVLDGIPLNALDVAHAELYVIGSDGAGLRRLRGSPAAHPSWNPVPG